MKILVHQCCAPCSIYPVSRLTADGADVHGYFYNPNIHPYTEYKKRLDTLKVYNDKAGIPYTVIDFYGLRPFIAMAFSASDRCEGCYRMRLQNIVSYAATNGFEYFTTTLLYSRRQKHDLIAALAREYASGYSLEFWYEDYRKGWQVGIDLSKEMGLYRQNYCGCVFSEEERFNKGLK